MGLVACWEQRDKTDIVSYPELEAYCPSPKPTNQSGTHSPRDLEGIVVAPDNSLNMDVIEYLSAKQDNNIEKLISLISSRIQYEEKIAYSWAETPNTVGAWAASEMARQLNDPSVPVTTTLQKHQQMIVETEWIDELLANCQIDNRSTKEISLIVLYALSNPKDKFKVLRNRIRESDGISILTPLLGDEKQEVRHCVSNLFRNLYYQWPSVIREMEDLGAIQLQAQIIPKFEKAEYIRDCLLNIHDYIHNVQDKVIPKTVYPLIECKFLDKLKDVENKLEQIKENDDTYQQNILEIRRKISELRKHIVWAQNISPRAQMSPRMTY